jgi:hypothetical protein
MKYKRCFACDKRLGQNPRHAVTSDGQVVAVGSECYKQIGTDGWQPPKGGPVLFRGPFTLSGVAFDSEGKLIS